MTSTLTRRDFLERAAGAAAFLSFTQASVAAGRMFVSLNGALTAGKNVGWPEFARLAARVGYGGVDWSLGPAQAEGLERTKALFAELQIKPTITNLPMARSLPFGGEDAAFREALVKLADDAAFCAAIGCRKMMVVLPPTGPLPKDEYRKAVRDRIAAVSEVLQKSNVRLGLEFLGVRQFRAGRTGGPPPHPFIWTLPETVALAKDCGANIGVILDVWHWHHSEGTTADIINTDKSRIVHIHVSDARPMPPDEVRDNMRVMPGEGSIDLVGFFQALGKIGYEEGVSPEPLGRVPAEMSAEEAARLGLETTLSVMRKAGVA
ncbi:MAG TPA: sugar phosphate isomerase/epimerase family protein [Vicinamibacterales bacterium]|jgi:sugar phosphate isomerase/epimerase|nr:sugar phosphate isomerase/epimerase family protein [Vicinamibacterales bacterium]